MKEEEENLFLKKEQKRKHIKEEMWAIYFYYLKDNPMVGLKTRNNNNSVFVRQPMSSSFSASYGKIISSFFFAHKVTT